MVSLTTQFVVSIFAPPDEIVFLPKATQEEIAAGRVVQLDDGTYVSAEAGKHIAVITDIAEGGHADTV